MFPYFDGTNGIQNVPGLLFPFLNNNRYFGDSLPDDVKAGIESKKDSIESVEDLHDIADELMQRR